MGRTSRTRHSAYSTGDRSRRCKPSRKMSTKNAIRKRRSNEKTNHKNIKTLFEAIRKESMRSISIRSDDSISDNTVIEVKNLSKSNLQQNNNNATPSRSNKRKSPLMTIHEQKRAKLDKNLVIIDEDEVEKLGEPCHFVFREVNRSNDGSARVQKSILNIQCSTPIKPTRHTTSLQDLIISNFPQSKSAHHFTEDVSNLSHEISRESASFVTIDLTNGTLDGCASKEDPSKKDNTVINLVEDTLDLEEGECTITGIHSVMSADSDITVVNMSERKKEEKVHKYINRVPLELSGLCSSSAEFIATVRKNSVTILDNLRASSNYILKAIAGRIANLDASGKVLKNVIQQIFTGCKMMHSAAEITKQHQPIEQPRPAPTLEDEYIKAMLLAGTVSRNSIGSNIYNPDRHTDRPPTGLRMVVIDGSNVAMQHGRGRHFSVKGLKICIDYFLKRGHVVKAFVPRFRCKNGRSTDPRLLDELERLGLVIYTPSREIKGRLVTSYDDRYIVQCAAEFDGVIVSGDNYRDLMTENPRWQFVIENRLLQFTWVDDMIMFPKDPLGRNGPTLEQLLKHPKHPIPKPGPKT